MLCRSSLLLRQASLRASGARWRPIAVRCMAEGKSQAYKFGQWHIDPSEVFAKSALSFAFVNLKPIVPGHVLVAPLREAPRFRELTPAEVTDIWSLAQRVGGAVEKHYNADSLTLTIQDGPAAGQTVPHLHIHVLPRRTGDFDPNDKVYDAIDESSKDAASHRSGEPLNLDAERVERTPEQMAAEAAELRQLFAQQQ